MVRPVLRLNFQRRPEFSLPMWHRFLEATNGHEDGAEYLDLWRRESSDVWTAHIHEQMPSQIVAALFEEGFFETDLPTFEWLRFLVRDGSAASVILAFEVLATMPMPGQCSFGRDSNQAIRFLEAMENFQPNLPESLIAVGVTTGEDRLKEIGTVLAELKVRHSVGADLLVWEAGR